MVGLGKGGYMNISEFRIGDVIKAVNVVYGSGDVDRAYVTSFSEDGSTMYIVDLDCNHWSIMDRHEPKLVERQSVAISLDKINISVIVEGQIMGMVFHNTPENLRGKGDLFKASNGILIRSNRSPDFDGNRLDLCGTNIARDGGFRYLDNNFSAGRPAFNKYMEALMEFNQFLLDKAA
jgi:hypothetical protein